MSLPAFLAELRRRRVFRVAAVYAVVAGLVVQVAATTFPLLGFPEWMATAVLVLALAGFPMALVLAWAYDLTPEGVVRTEPEERASVPKSGDPDGFTRRGAGAVRESRAANAIPAGPPLVVLPFANMSADAENEYFSDGLSEELLNVLAQIPALRVVARTSSFAFKGKGVPVDEIANRLRATHVLEGSVRNAGQRVRIAAQLIAAEDGYHVWSETYDRELSDIFAVQDEIARAIASALRVRLEIGSSAVPASAGGRPAIPPYAPALGLPPTRARIPGELGPSAPNLRVGDALGSERPRVTRARETSSIEAHTSYLKGRFFHNQGTPEALEKALGYYRQALEHDPEYALAYVGIGDAYGTLADSVLSPEEALPKVVEAARKAIELNDALSEAHALLAMVEVNWGWNWPVARQALDRALELNPSNAVAHLWYGGYWIAMGDSARAVAAIRQAHRLDPLSPVMSWFLMLAHLMDGDPDAALAQHEVTQEIAPGFVYLDPLLGDAYRYTGMYAEAIDAYRHEEPAFGRPASGLAIVYAHMGQREEAERIAADLERHTADGEYVAPELIARIHVALGDHDRAFEWLEKGYEIRAASMVALKLWRDFAPIRSDPRYRRLRERMGLP